MIMRIRAKSRQNFPDIEHKLLLLELLDIKIAYNI